MFGVSLSTSISFLVKGLFEEILSKDEILSILLKLYKSNTNGLYIQVDSIVWIGKESGVINKHGTKITNVNATKYKKLQKIVFENVKKHGENGKLINNSNLGYILYRWKNFAPNELKTFITSQITTDNGLIRLLTGLLSYTFTSSEEGKYPEVHKKYVEELIGDEAPLVARIRKVKEDSAVYNTLNDKSKIAIDAILKRVDNPDDYYGI